MKPYQIAVAQQMKMFHDKQKKAGKNLMFILTVGDNFYSTGLTGEDALHAQWTKIYGHLATD